MKNTKTYSVPVRVTGTFFTRVNATSAAEAYNKASILTENADFGALQEIDWDVGEPVSFDAAVHDISVGGDATEDSEKFARGGFGDEKD